MSDIMFKACIKTVEKAHDEHERLYSEIFAELPDRDMYPDYYEVITDPISIKEIRQQCADSKYNTFEDLAKDFDLMFKNAKTYNQEGSGVYQDAVDLENVFVRALSMAKGGIKPSFKKIKQGVNVGDGATTLMAVANGAGTANARTTNAYGQHAQITSPSSTADGSLSRADSEENAMKRQKLEGGEMMCVPPTMSEMDDNPGTLHGHEMGQNAGDDLDEYEDDVSSEDEQAKARMQIPISSLHKTAHVGQSQVFMDRQESSMPWMRRAMGFKDIPIVDRHN